ncbi:MAG: hypothetical protein JRJ76_04570 [Deltaproteobacteria bacterium]|nr:hypothetical protein [Deltaproteobacteria bacterium]
MLKKLIQKLQTLTKGQDTFDPSQFNDPLAIQVGWTPVKRGGTSFQTRKLVKVSPYRIEFCATGFAVFFYIFFAFAGMSLLIGYSISKYKLNQLLVDVDTIIPLVIGLIFTIAGGCMLYFGTASLGAACFTLARHLLFLTRRKVPSGRVGRHRKKKLTRKP